MYLKVPLKAEALLPLADLTILWGSHTVSIVAIYSSSSFGVTGAFYTHIRERHFKTLRTSQVLLYLI